MRATILAALVLLPSGSALADYIRTSEMTAYIPKYLGFALDMAKVDAMRIGGRIVPVPTSFSDAEVSEYEEKRDGSICRIYPADLMGRIYKKEGDKYEDLGKPEFVAFQCYRSPSSAFIDPRTYAEQGPRPCPDNAPASASALLERKWQGRGL